MQEPAHSHDLCQRSLRGASLPPRAPVCVGKSLELPNPMPPPAPPFLHLHLWTNWPDRYSTAHSILTPWSLPGRRTRHGSASPLLKPSQTFLQLLEPLAPCYRVCALCLRCCCSGEPLEEDCAWSSISGFIRLRLWQETVKIGQENLKKFSLYYFLWICFFSTWNVWPYKLPQPAFSFLQKSKQLNIRNVAVFVWGKEMTRWRKYSMRKEPFTETLMLFSLHPPSPLPPKLSRIDTAWEA